MSHRRPAILRQAEPGRTIRDHLVGTAARLLDERGSTGLTVRDIASHAHVAIGALYNHFTDKEELLAVALAAHVETVMRSGGELPHAGEGTVQENLGVYVEYGLAVLTRVLPAFAGFLSQPGVIERAGRLLGAADGAPGLPNLVTDYLRAEQEIGRINAASDLDAAATLIVGACHEFVLPRMLFNPDAPPVQVPAELVDHIVATVFEGIAPPARSRPRRPTKG